VNSSPGKRIAYGVTDSTNERALAAIADGTARDGDWHVALEQSAGRGRLGRTWHSPAGQGLYLSLVHCPGEPLPPAAPSIAAGLALLDTIRAMGVEGARLRWPNDLLVQGAKLAGILVETRGWDPTSPSYVIGVGVNVTGADLPQALHDEREVVSLDRLGLETTAQALEQPLLARLRARLAQAAGPGGDELCADYLAALGLGTGSVLALKGSTRTSGPVVGLDFDRGVGIETDRGQAWIPLEFLTELKGLQ
jgi:BirA family biotin operon repressor/biotin-[acetyl-CoA-carboxylase] ligase